MTLRYIMIFGSIVLAGGCAASNGPEVVRIEPTQYRQAYSTAVAVVRDRGWEPEIMDPRSGVIESGATQSGSLFEPWHLTTTDLPTIVESSLAKTRTRVRIEFRPAHRTRLARSGQADIAPPDYLAGDEGPDLTSAAFPLDLRAWVYIEHGYRPNVMRSTWMPHLQAAPRRTGHDASWESPPKGVVWVPTSRDRTAERSILHDIEAAMQINQPVQALQSPPQG